MSQFLVSYKTYGGRYLSVVGEMLVEADTIEEAEQKARMDIVEDTGYGSITDFSIKLKDE